MKDRSKYEEKKPRVGLKRCFLIMRAISRAGFRRGEGWWMVRKANEFRRRRWRLVCSSFQTRHKRDFFLLKIGLPSHIRPNHHTIARKLFANPLSCSNLLQRARNLPRIVGRWHLNLGQNVKSVKLSSQSTLVPSAPFCSEYVPFLRLHPDIVLNDPLILSRNGYGFILRSVAR